MREMRKNNPPQNSNRDIGDRSIYRRIVTKVEAHKTVCRMRLKSSWHKLNWLRLSISGDGLPITKSIFKTLIWQICNIIAQSFWYGMIEITPILCIFKGFRAGWRTVITTTDASVSDVRVSSFQHWCWAQRFFAQLKASLCFILPLKPRFFYQAIHRLN